MGLMVHEGIIKTTSPVLRIMHKVAPRFPLGAAMQDVRILALMQHHLQHVAGQQCKCTCQVPWYQSCYGAYKQSTLTISPGKTRTR